MKQIIFISFMVSILFLCHVSVNGQNRLLTFEELGDVPEYQSLEIALLDADNVYKLTLRDQQIEELPQKITKLKNLQVLNLSKNHNLNIEQSLKVLSSITNLQILSFDETSLVTLPEEIELFQNLRVLGLDQNPNMDLGQILLRVSKLKKMQYLFLAKNNISALPPEIEKIQSVEYLYLNNNRLNELPKEMGNLMNLEILDISGNEISKEEISQTKVFLPNAMIMH